jgi:hypothetical protein
LRTVDEEEGVLKGVCEEGVVARVDDDSAAKGGSDRRSGGWVMLIAWREKMGEGAGSVFGVRMSV